MTVATQKRKRRQVDFKALKERADFTAVLYHYKLTLTPKEDELIGNCPFHEDTSAAFSVNIKKGVFNCFGCKARGSILDFVGKKEGVGVRKAASVLTEICKIEMPYLSSSTNRGSEQPDQSGAPAGSGDDNQGDGPTGQNVVNPPLTFELKLDSDHAAMSGLGLKADTIRHFGLGYCSRGVLKDRIAIPIHDGDAALVAYAGRRTDAGSPNEAEPLYKFPVGFHADRIVFNLHRVPECARSAIVVEDFLSVFWLHECDLPIVVGLPTRSASPIQLGLLRERFEQIHFFLENADGKRIDLEAGIMALSRQRFVRRTACPPGKRPYELSGTEIKTLLGYEI